MKQTIFTLIAVLILQTTGYGQTNVSGGIYTNTTWTKANSPYIVTDTVVVFPGVTLTIEPGVEVRFEDDMMLEIRQSSLIALGTSTDTIRFTSNSFSPHSGSWGNIYLNLENGIMSSNFKYCSFQYAVYGIRIERYNYPPSPLPKLNIDNSLFSYNKRGIISAYNQSVDISINSSIFRDNDDYGAYVETPKGRVIDCIFSRNNIGIEIRKSLVKDCLIDSNYTAGIRLQYSDTITNCQIVYNGIGIEEPITFYNGDNTITKSIITNNTIGMKLTLPNNQISCNRICQNVSYDFLSNAAFSSNIQLKDNYWCTTDTAIIMTKIYDGYDNTNLGLVNFMPIDTSQCYLTGCNLNVNATITNASCGTCSDGEAIANVVGISTPPYTFTWYSSPLQNSQAATGLAPGNYDVCVIDANGCSACASVFIDSTNCNGLAVTTQSTNASCSACNDGTATATVFWGTPPYSFTWYTAPLQNTSVASGLPQGSYVVCVTDLYGCVACDTVDVSVGSCSAFFNLYSDSVPHTYYAVNLASGVSPLSYVWSWGDGTYDSVAYPNHTFSTAGYYDICLSITDSVGCTNTHCSSYFLQKQASTMIHVNVVDPLTTGISNNATEMPFVFLFPNPAKNILHVAAVTNTTVDKLNYQIINLLGESVTAGSSTAHEFGVDVSELTAGVYFIHIQSNNGNAIKRWVKE